MSTTTNLGLTVDVDKSTVDIPGFVDQTDANMEILDAFAATVRRKATRESFTVQTSGWGALNNKTPYNYSATVTATATIGNDTLVELINDNAVLFATHGFAIGAISGQSITIYSVGAPSASVTLTIEIGG